MQTLCCIKTCLSSCYRQHTNLSNKKQIQLALVRHHLNHTATWTVQGYDRTHCGKERHHEETKSQPDLQLGEPWIVACELLHTTHKLTSILNNKLLTIINLQLSQLSSIS